jgi:PAS domain S-box-containing protein
LRRRNGISANEGIFYMTEQYPAEWLYHQIAENVGDAFIFSDPAGNIRLWSPGAEKMFGYSAEEALGKSLDLIVPENLRSRHWEGYFRVMDNGATMYATELLAVPALRRDGGRISIEFTIALVRGPGGQILGAGAVVREVTDRWNREGELRRRLAQLETEREKKEGQ